MQVASAYDIGQSRPSEDWTKVFCWRLAACCIDTYMYTVRGWFRESKLTQLIKECLSSSTSRVCMIAHVSPATHAYNETLQVLQLASRLQRLRTRRKASKVIFSMVEW